ncbi:MAG: efflux RND transporter permease subunit [Phycisphaerales bacterium]|nr:MAG: efflux RND transporter permease subunit [Phycisphaerales bacterium]
MVNALIKTFLRSPLLALVLGVVLLAWGWRSFDRTPKDAIPDIADNQVIVFTDWMGRSPKDVDEQVTYPLTVALQGVPNVREIRATSGFGWSIVYVVFQDQVDFYWARSRVLERLNVAQTELPEGVTPTLGPDATALGQVFWYTVENGWYSPSHPGLRFNEDGTLTEASRAALLKADPSLEEKLDNAEPYQSPLTGEGLVFSQLPLDELRSIQDFDVKLALESVEGVSQAASIGGYVRQYQIDVNPEALRAFGVSLAELVSAVRSSNLDVGAKVVEQQGMEVFVRGVGFLGGGERSTGTRAERERAAIRDIENIVVKARDDTPIYVRQLATVATGPDFRRGALDKMGAEAVGGCVVMRFGENPLDVITRVKAKITAIEPGLPPGVRINACYDRTELINETMATLGSALSQELVITIVAVLLFLLHFRSSLVIAVTLPLAVLFAFICMRSLGVPSNIMSLAGIAIAIGTMVDMGIVMTENVYQTLTDNRSEYVRVEVAPNGRERQVIDKGKRAELLEQAALEVGPAIVTATTTTILSFLPVFFLEGQAAKLFTPLAWTKTFCMAGSVLLALTIIPPLAGLLLRERRFSRARSAVVSLIVAGGIAGAWAWADRFESAARIKNAVLTYLGIPPWLMLLLIVALAFIVTWFLLRERIRPISENPVSRLIRYVYEPTLRWILHHKPIFLAIPIVIVVWGLSIWLGWGNVLRILVAPMSALGLSIADWSLAWWVHLVLGLFIGVLILPLLLESIRLLRLRGQGNVDYTSPLRTWAKRILSVVIGVLLGFGLDRIGLVDHSRAVAAMFGADAASVQSGGEPMPRQMTPLADLLEKDTGIGQEFMPPLDEGDFLYMPSVLPAGSFNTVMEVMQKQDVQFAQIPEVESVVGKLGRIDSALDPAPVGMLETMILLRPREEWPVVDDPEHPGHMRKRTMSEIWDAIKEAGRYPGVLPSAELQPIRTRVEMLSTGLNAKIGIKVYGDSLARCEELAVDVERILREKLEGAQAINAVRVSGKPYLEFFIDREAVARYGVSITDVQQVIEVAVGGKNLTTTFEGLDRYPVRIRYQRELRDDVPNLERILIPTPSGAQIPIAQVAEIRSVVGPMSVRREGAKYVSYVTMNNVGVDETTLVHRGQAILDRAVIDGALDVPDGYYLKWTGSYERNLRAKKRLALLLPLVLLINLLLIYFQFKRFPLALVIFFAIPVAFAGGFLFLEYWPQIQDSLYLAGIMDRPFPGDAMYLTVAVWVGFIALFGIAVDDGIVLGTYLDQTFSRKKIRRFEEIEERVVEAGLRRIRPCLMTTFTTLAALTPVLISTGRGSDVMTPMALPVFGGMFVVLVSLFVVPTCFCAIKQFKWHLGLPDQDFHRD